MSTENYLGEILNGDIMVLSKALSMFESTLERDRTASLHLLEKLLPHTGGAIRVGITGAPGVGKSTFIEALGLYLVNQGKKIAVLTVDPSSPQSKGSILGDKTRMELLSRSPNAFIRPSATGNSLGGVTQHTRESILLCEAAGYDVVIVETVGVGQSEIKVREMVDFFLLLMIAGAGDELQGIKKGIVEIADTLVITKADGDNLNRSRETQTIFKNALHMLSADPPQWQPQVLTCSSKLNQGITEVWDTVLEYQAKMKEIGFFKQQRQQQRVKWMHDCIGKGLEIFMKEHHEQLNLHLISKEVAAGKLLPVKAANDILAQVLQR